LPPAAAVVTPPSVGSIAAKRPQSSSFASPFALCAAATSAAEI